MTRYELNDQGYRERVMDQWQGKGSESAAWAECHRAAAVLRHAGLTARYGVKVAKRGLRIRDRFTWEYRVVLVDRTPRRKIPPAAVQLLNHERQEAAA